LANNTDKLRTPGQFLRSIPFSKVQHGLYTIVLMPATIKNWG